MTRFFLLLVFSAFAFCSNAQSTVISNDKTFGGSGTDFLFTSVLLNNKTIVAGGYSISPISGDKNTIGYGREDYWIVNLDSNLNPIWEKTYGGSENDNLIQIIQTKDNNILCVGTSNSGISGNKTVNNKGQTDFWLIKLDLNGNELWQKTYGGDSADAYPKVIENSDGTLLIVGASNSIISGDKTDTSRGIFDFWLLKIDELGNVLWDKTIGGNKSELYPNITLTSNEEIIISGISSSDSSGEKTENSIKYPNTNYNTDDIWIIKLDTSGNVVWDKTHGGDLFESSVRTLILNNKIYVASTTESGATGNKTTASKGDSDIWLISMDLNGNKLWEKTYGGSLGENIGDISSTLNDEIILYGSSNSNISGDKTENRIGSADYWIINIDTIGNINWQKTIGGIGMDLNFGGFQTSANKFILTGSSDSNIGGDKTENNRGDIDFWLVELTVSTVGISESKKEHLDFKIFPNPAKDFLNIHIHGKTAFEIEIYNSLGELVVQENMNGNKKQLNVSHLTEGSYIIKLISEDRTQTSRFVK